MKLLLLYGEESGAIYAEAIRRTPALAGAEIRGYADYGFSVASLAVMGFFAVLWRLRFFLKVYRVMRKAIDQWHPDVVISIDYPGMNLRLDAYARKLGIRTVHVVCPQVWAWKRGRIPKIAAAVDKLVCFLPFEPALFPKGKAVFFGHPLVGELSGLRRDNCRQTDLVALLPGSRLGEIERILPTLLKAATSLATQAPKVRFAIPAANARAQAAILRIVKTSGISVRVQLGNARELLAQATVAVVASGTATMEAALLGAPTLLVYRVNVFLAFLARRLIRGIRHIGLVNIIWEKGSSVGLEPMRELIQETFTVEAVENWLIEQINSPELRKEVVARQDAALSPLGCDNAIERIAVLALAPRLN